MVNKQFSKPGWLTIHILINISRSKGNQTMKFGQANEAGRLDPDLFFTFQKSFICVQVVCSLVSRYFINPQLGIQNKLHKTLDFDPEISSILSF